MTSTAPTTIAVEARDRRSRAWHWFRRSITAASVALALCGLLPVATAHGEASGARSHQSFSSRLDSGDWHSCAISPSGQLYCWGYGETWGALGYGNTENVGDNETPASVGPVNLGEGRTAKAVSAGDFFGCAILDNGAMKCWGTNNNGRLGYPGSGVIGDDETPAAVGTVDIGSGRTATAISAGEADVCVILDNGSVRCWGAAEYGQLGYGNKNAIGDDETPGSVGPVNLGVNATAKAIALGNAYACAILDNGQVRCWGFNNAGQLGTGNTASVGDDETPASVPPVNLGAGRTAVAIATGWDHTCAILDTGGVKCWGDGGEGKLGYGNTNTVLSPASVGTVDLGAGRTAIDIAAAEHHTCAILDNGTVRCWGESAYGQLGYGTTATIGDNETPGSMSPVDLGSGRRAVSITAGKIFTCAQLDDGSKRCWGDATYGQLGSASQIRVGATEPPSAGGLVDMGSAHGVLETAAGNAHTCALTDTGTVRCWGLNSSGQLGYGNTANIGDNEIPGMAGPVALGGHNAVEIATGEAHTCALLDDGTVRCWGKGSSGQLGYGNTANIGDNETPASVSPVALGGESAIAISAGANHTCAAMTGGGLRCWGAAGNGQLGYGNTANVGDNEAPSAAGTVNVGRSVTGVTAGANHTCAQLDDATLRCWGLGASGRLGYGNETTIGDNEVPSSVGTVNLGFGATPTEESGGGSHTCALVGDGTLRCWGLGTSGRLGYSNTASIGDNETAGSGGIINVGPTAVGIAAGGSHSCATLSNGTARCWGLASSGQLGYANTEDIGDNETPVLVGPISLGTGRAVLSVSAGGSHSCAVLDNGTVRCWGLNSSGQLGYANANNIGDDESPATAGPVDFVDDAPTAVADSATIAEDAVSAPVDVLANDTDPDAGPKAIAAKTNGAHGTVAITEGGNGLTYTPEADYCGADSFTYELSPGGSTATVSVTVSCVDDAPTAVADSATIAEDSSPTTIDVLANDTDVDGGTKKVEGATNGAHATVAILGTALTYAPGPNYCGPDSFTYTLNGGSTATVSVTVSCADDAPSAVNDLVTVTESVGPTPLDVLANDTDVDGGPKAIASKTNGAHGTVAIAEGGSGLTYAPDIGYCGPDSFSYELAPGGSTATVSVTVTCVEEPPVAVEDSDTLTEDAPATAIDVLANDTDVDGGEKLIIGRTNGAHGSVAIIGAGAGLTYTPAPDYCGPDSFTYTLNGGSTATVSVNVTCVDELAPPEASPDPQLLTQVPVEGGTVQSGATSVVSITPGVGVVSGRRRPRVAVKGVYAFFTLTCKLVDRDCKGLVRITINVPSITLGPTMRNVAVVKGRFRIGSGRSVLVRARLTRPGLQVLERKQSLRGVSAHMAIVDTGNDERGSIAVNLVRRPKASLLPNPRRSRSR